jgi:cleavage and polyadenylation specificity factor subunit 5
VGADLYPYCPPHISRPKECRRLYIVPLPQQGAFVVPRGLKLLAISLMDLYDNRQTYGLYISSIPLFLSRFTFTYL